MYAYICMHGQKESYLFLKNTKLIQSERKAGWGKEGKKKTKNNINKKKNETEKKEEEANDSNIITKQFLCKTLDVYKI